MSRPLDALLRPGSIAIIGASPNVKKVSGRPLKNLLDKGYAGKLYPINSKYPKMGDLECFPNIEAVPGTVDLAVLVIPARDIPAAMAELGRKGVPAAIVFSSGFAERGDEGRALQDEVARVAAKAGVRVCGPNCMGLINSFDSVVATFSQYAEGEVSAGPLAFVTQSGAFGTAIASLARLRGLGIGYLVHTGNECDVDFAEVMGDVLTDARIRLAAGYLEGLEDISGLRKVADAALAQGKPLILTKVGRSTAGARAALAHTGALSGDDSVFAEVCRELGIVRARNEEHMLDMVEVFLKCAVPRGRGLGIITMSGGAGVLIADRAEELGLGVPILRTETQQAIRSVLPDFAAMANPVDVTGQFLVDPPILRESVLKTLSDPQVDVGLIWLQLMSGHVDMLCDIFGEIKAKATKPFVFCWVAAPEEGVARLRKMGIAVLRSTEPAVDAVAALVQYGMTRRRSLEP
jgi:acetate---CoA ligase (ADP-forming)